MTFSQLSQNVQLSSKSMEVAGLLKWSCPCARRRARSRVLVHRQPECDALELTAGNFSFFDDQEEMRYIPMGDDVLNLAITKSQGPTLLCRGKFFASAFANRTPLCYRFLSSQ